MIDLTKQCNLILGDCLEKLKDLPSDSVDLIASDPPYGLVFMGKAWDVLPSIEILKECQRVLKSGAFAFWLMTPRQDSQAEFIMRLKQAGFVIGFTPIYWVYASGFPKAGNISKAIDRKGEACQQYSILSKELCNYLKQSRELKKLSQKDIAQSFLSKTGGLTGCVWNWENGANIPTLEQWDKLKQLLDLQNEKFNELIERAIIKRIEAEREIIGKDGRGELKDNMFFSQNIDKAKEKGKSIGYGKWDITINATKEAKKFDGSFAGFQPKPAVEVIVVSMKPLSEKTFVEQALKNGKGITWLGECRIPYASQQDNDQMRQGIVYDGKDQPESEFNKNFGLKSYDSSQYHSEVGRFPANLLVSDDALNDGTVSKDAGIGGRGSFGRGEGYGFKPTGEKDIVPPTGEGSFSRYFSLDAWWANKVKLLPKAQRSVFPFLIEPKASKGEKNEGCDMSIDNSDKYNGKFPCSKADKDFSNKHPTVKPVDLMSYLITLGSRPKDLVLDPFLGSGTTGVAVLMLNRRFVGMEIEKDYFEIAKKRVSDWEKQTRLI